ncbi:MAG: PLP-dependent aminotransferase family protein [Lachnospiraceae bacterium]|nr:PLP-dependent aminotransferase family protein [Lachnospiraceae bacterium]
MQNLTLNFTKESENLPLYLQIYNQIVHDIKNGIMKTGEKLPSKKQLCLHLCVSQTTVENAYEMLLTEGYIRSIPKSGYYVLPYESLQLSYKKKGKPIPALNNSQLDTDAYHYNLSTGSVDTTGFPFTTWAKISKEVMYNEPALLSQGSNQGDLTLRGTLIKYLHEFRGVNADSSQLIIGAGTEYLLSLLCRILNEVKEIAMENPCYMRVYHNFLDHHKHIVPLPVTSNGISLDALNQSNCDLVYITPSHQYPTGVTMPIGNRVRLINWANEKQGRYILEDDYDSEYRFSGRPIPSLQGLDQHGKVIYLGTFSRSIAPSIRISYMLLPKPLLDIYVNRFFYCSSTVSRFEQNTLERFISGGYYTRHLNRTRNLYKRRKEELLKLMKIYFRKDSYVIYGENLGLHFLIEIRNGMSEQELISLALTEKIKIKGLSEYYIEGASLYPTLVMGYSGLMIDEINIIIPLLKKVWNL